MTTTAYLLIQAGFIGLTIIFFGFLLYEIRKALAKSSIGPAQRGRIFLRLLGGLLLWSAFTSFWSLSGKMGNFSMFPFNMIPILVVPLIAILLLTFSKTADAILIHIPVENIIRLQSFRIFVELLLWALFIQNLAPVQMTFEGRNLDILSGISAPIVAYFVSRQKISAVGIAIWNFLSLALLINILATAILSMPTPLRVFINDPSNTIVTEPAVAWLPAFLVPLAYGLHFVSLRQLSLRQRKVVAQQ